MPRAPILACSVASIAAAVVTVATVACSPVAPPRLPARPPGCALETLVALPERPYIELETFNLPSPESLREAVDSVRDRACRDGADAIYAPKGGKVYSYAIALKWRDAPAPPPPASPAPPSLR